ncbi:MAG: 4-hydroxy-tetrahydrodipicolinate reductase [Alicyclobacillaceae bacterium]|nr:4-hydroxy-tetrahydrodipicolinate reductase [Alicyclobacillaceae bacterium]
MGSEAVRTLARDARFRVTALLVRDRSAFTPPADVPAAVYDDPEQLLVESPPDVWLDFTDATSVVANVDRCIAHRVRPVIGATGYSPADVARWDEMLREEGIGGVAAPNFAIGALLMMRFAAEAARFFERAEVIELHHDGKKDAPSGTAKRTAELIRSARGAGPDTPIHSVRLPGLVAHQEVLFGGSGEVLTIRHDSLSRQSFMAGVQVACTQVMNITGLVYGLEHLLW